jgi:uracil-DNA glycosylase family 4
MKPQSGEEKIDSLETIAADVVACKSCPRLRAHCMEVSRTKRRAYADQDYWGLPVPGFGDASARLVVVGLAPAAHGANRTGRLFTGDSSGDWLWRALHETGFASQPKGRSRVDGLTLTGCYVTAAVRCAPPANRPVASELAACRPHLAREMRLLAHASLYMALGRIAFEALLATLPELGLGPLPARSGFRHGGLWPLEPGGRTLMTSYHPSRQNTQTGRLTRRMFHAVFRRARRLIADHL